MTTFANNERCSSDQRLDEINFFEQMPAQEGALILKFWFHIFKNQNLIISFTFLRSVK
jgi:polyphosphate kinase 2 (PPK2 family)